MSHPDLSSNRPAAESQATPRGAALAGSEFSAAVLEYMLNGVAYCKMEFVDGRPADFIYLYVNPAFHKQTGLGPVAGKRVSEVIPGIKDADPQLFEIYGRVALGGHPETFETYIESLRLWFSVQVFSPCHEHFVAVFDVITERKQQEAELLKAQERLSLAQRTSSSGVWDWIVATGEIVWSDEHFHLFGLDPASASASFESWRRVVHPDDLKAAEDNILKSVRDHVQLVNEYRIILPSGKIRWIAAYGDTTYDQDGQPLRMAGICLDITQRKHDETNQKLLSEITAHAAEGISLISAADGTFIYTNQQFNQIFGYAEGELIGKPVAIINAPGEITPEETAAQITQILERTGQWHGEILNARKDGTFFWTRANIAKFHHAELGTLWITHQADISEKKQAEADLSELNEQLELRIAERTRELLLAKEAAESANLAKSAFLANMSHEIRTPMNGILGMANILRREGVTPKQAERLDKIDTSAKHLLHIIDNILDISKIEAGKFRLEESPVSVSGILTNVAAILTERAKAKGISLSIEAGNLPANLYGDPTRLQQALLNYVANAVKFSEKGTVTLRTLKLGETRESVMVRFDVADTGIGISPDNLSRLFTTFEQADNSITRKYGGSGLGLAITRRLAELMGGEVGAESQLGVGSTFWFTARLKKGAAEEISQATPDIDAEEAIRKFHKGRRILVVDDEQMNREVAQIQLEGAGLVVDAAQDGEEAITMAQELHYAAIFMDMQMPNVDGLEATRQIRLLPNQLLTPIIAMTANAFAEDRKLCIAAGMNDFLIKPFTPDTLFATLLRSLSRHTV